MPRRYRQASKASTCQQGGWQVEGGGKQSARVSREGGRWRVEASNQVFGGWRVEASKQVSQQAGRQPASQLAS